LCEHLQNKKSPISDIFVFHHRPQTMNIFKAFYYFALLLKNRKIKKLLFPPLKSTVWNSWCENIDSNLPPYAHPLMPYLFFNFCQKPSYFANQEIAPLLYYYAVIIVFSSSCVKSRRWKKPTTILLWKKTNKNKSRRIY